MNETLRQYMDSLFADAPQTAGMVELKEEMIQNLTDKYNDLRAEGKSEEAAYNIAVASIGDVRALIDGMTAEGGGRSAAAEKAAKRSALLVSVAIALYILCVIPLFLIQNEVGLVIMFAVAAIATGMLIYNGATKQARYVKTDDTVVEEFKEWQQEKSHKNRARSAIQGAVWLLIVCLYLIVSFLTGIWHISWIIFPIGGAVSLIISGIFDLKE